MRTDRISFSCATSTRATNGSASPERYRTVLLANAFDSVAKRIENNLRRLIGCEIREYKARERLSGRELSWEQAWEE